MRQRKAFVRVDIEEGRRLLAEPGIVVLDVRDPKSYAQAHMAGAKNASIANLSAVMAETPKAAPILIYCYHGYASQEYAQVFSDFGYLNVFSLDGGWEAWRQHAAPESTLAPALRAFLARHGFEMRLDAVVANGTTPLMKAALVGDVDAIAKLIAAGAPLEARNNDGNTALWLACVGHHLPAIAALVAAGIDLNNRNDNDATALMYAASTGKAAVVDALLKAGADRSLQTLDGFTALDMAATLECLMLLRPPRAAKGKPLEAATA